MTDMSAYFENGFRKVHGRPAAQNPGEPVFAMAVNMLASNLKGGKAHAMGQFLNLALAAVQKNGYSITYAFGPEGEFGLMVAPMDPDSNRPDLSQDPDDYSMWCEIGGVKDLEECLHRYLGTAVTVDVPGQREPETESEPDAQTDGETNERCAGEINPGTWPYVKRCPNRAVDCTEHNN